MSGAARRGGRRQREAEARRAHQPHLEFPDALPISARAQEIADAIRDHPVVVVCGETGSGKTTQLPKICLEIGRGIDGMIGHTQPRRLAARSVAARIAEETRLPLGGGIGYQVRFDDRSEPGTRVKLMTDGILLNELGFDHDLRRYDTLIIDEAHERSLNIDFILGYLKRLLPRRPDLKVIITSATIDPDRFSRHFGDAPVIEVSGRGYPVEVRYEAPAADTDLADALTEAARRLLGELPEGDILAFLPGEREIREAAEALERARLGSRRGEAGWEILPLYGRLSETSQGRVFRPGRRRRIVLATNVAETSLTVPRIMAVIDSGLARISRYSYRSKIQRLQVEPVSQASANQRSGRCGRIAPGICVRLYDEEDYLARPAFTDPEIRRTNLASVILQMAAARLGEMEDFPFIDPPDARYVQDGYRLLAELEAVDDAREITEAGRRMAGLPVDPRLARMLLAAEERGELRDALVIVAGLAGADPRLFPPDEGAKARAAQEEFADPASDFVTLLKLWRAWRAARRGTSRRQAERWAEARYLSPRRLREWGEIHSQLTGLCRDAGMPVAHGAGNREALHKALLAGLLGHIGRRDEATRYDGPRGTAFHLHPSSGLHGQPPAWVFAMELVRTSRLFARTAAATEPGRILEVEPRWNPRRGRVEASETVTLFGLVLAAGRRVNYGPVDPAESRRIFVREALVQGRANHRDRFWRHNQAAIARIREKEGEARRAILIPDGEMAGLYEREIPEHVVDLRSFRNWLRKAAKRNPEVLCFPEQDLARDPGGGGTEMPAAVELLGQEMPVAYRFRPGEADDGATVRLPAPALAQLEPAQLDRALPPLVAERAELRLRSLPKALRRRLQPIADTAADFAARYLVMPGSGELEQALTDFLAGEFGITPDLIPAASADEPEHLRLRLEVTDETGKVIAAGRDLEALRAEVGDAAPIAGAARDESRPTLHRDWDFGELPGVQAEVSGALRLERFPALADRETGVTIEYASDEAEAATLHAGGVLRLLRLALPQQEKLLRGKATGDRRLQLAWAGVGAAGELAEDFVAAAFGRAFPGERRATVRNRGDYEALLDAGRSELVAAGEGLATLLGEILEARRLAAAAAADLPERLDDVRADIDAQLAGLVYPGFVTATPAQRLQCLPRYLRAAELRASRLPAGADRDRADAQEVAVCLGRLAQLEQRRASLDAERRALIDEFRWGIEELRVSLFAQQLGTRGKISPKRLEKLWHRITGVTR